MRAYRHRNLVLTASLGLLLSGCYVFDFFGGKGKSSGGGGAVYSGTVIGQPLGNKAKGPDEAALALVHGTAAVRPPAAIRPDPDVYVRRLLRQYRPEGATVARQIGVIEPFKLLLGGATDDFSKPPQEEYDATSLLAVLKVAEEICKGLVAPVRGQHEGWATILPYAPEQVNENVTWMAQRFIGLPSSRIDASVVPSLIAIMDAERSDVQSQPWAQGNPYAQYVPACATLALDAEALYL